MIHVMVRYQREEYVETLLDYAALQYPNFQKRWYNRFLLKFVGSLTYFYKVWKIGDCDFSIDAENIIRKTKSKTLIKPWQEVTAVYDFSSVYLLHTASGALPLPKRLLTPQQESTFLSYCSDKLALFDEHT